MCWTLFLLRFLLRGSSSQFFNCCCRKHLSHPPKNNKQQRMNPEKTKKPEKIQPTVAVISAGVLPIADDLVTINEFCRKNEIIAKEFRDQLIFEVIRFRRHYAVPSHVNITFNALRVWDEKIEVGYYSDGKKKGKKTEDNKFIKVHLRSTIEMVAMTHFTPDNNFTKVARTFQLFFSYPMEYKGRKKIEGESSRSMFLEEDRAAYHYQGISEHTTSAKHEAGFGKIIKFKLAFGKYVVGVEHDYFAMNCTSTDDAVQFPKFG